MHAMCAKPDLTCCVSQPNRSQLQALDFALHFGAFAVGAPNVVAQFIASLARQAKPAAGIGLPRRLAACRT